MPSPKSARPVEPAAPAEALAPETVITTATPVPLEGVGLDIGTANFAASRYSQVGDTLMKSITEVRDCFVLFPVEESPALDVAGVEYHVSKDKKNLFVIGKDAVKLSVALGSELRRPLARGFVSEREDLSKEILTLILTQVLGKPRFPDELAVFSIPGVPMDGDVTKAHYHTRFFSDRIKELGYQPLPINEAMAVCFAELYKLSEEGSAPLTGLCMSFGAGMINVALVYKSMLSKAFSIPIGGDYVDEAVAKATNSTPEQVCVLKEEGIDLLKGVPVKAAAHHDVVTSRQAEALGMVYRDLLTKLREALHGYFTNSANRIEIREPLPVIVSGGTTLAPGFLGLFNDIVLKDLGIRLPLVDEARSAANPLGSVAIGALRFARLRRGGM